MLRFLARNLVRSRGQLGSALFGVVAGVSIFAFFVALGNGIESVIEGEVFPIERLEVVKAHGASGMLGILPSATEGASTVTEQTVERVRGIEGVKSVYPRMRFAFPAKAWGGEELLGQRMWTEMIGDGIPAILVEDGSDSVTGFRFLGNEDSGRECSKDGDCPAGQYCGQDATGKLQCMHPVPFLISRHIIELYNGTMVSAHGLPPIPQWAIRKSRGLKLHMDIGRSSLGESTSGRPREVLMRFAGVSEQAIDIGITVPIEYVEQWNAEFADGRSSAGYSSLTVVVSHRQKVTRVVEELKRMGLSIESHGQEQVGLMIMLFQGTFTVIAVLMLAISAFTIAHVFFLMTAQRRKEIGIMRAVGATRWDILGSLMAEGAILGVVGGLVGVALALLLAVAGNYTAAHHIPDFPYKPDDFFEFSPGLVAASLGLGVLSSLAGALPAAFRASRQDPSSSLM